MKKLRSSIKFLVVPALAVAVIVIFAFASPARMQKLDEPQADAQGSGAAKVSGLVSLLPGQVARVSAVNVGNKDVPLEFVFVPVNEQGKAQVPIQCNAIVTPGDTASAVFRIPDGTSNRQQFYVQVRVRQSIGLLRELVPSLEVYNEQSGSGAQFVLSGADFVEIRPIFVP